MDKKEMFEEWKKTCEDKLQTFEIISEFEGMSKKMKFKCLICGHICEYSPYDFRRLKTRGCKQCDNNKRRRNENDYIESVKKSNPHFDDIIIGEYKSKRDKIEVTCKKCGYVNYYMPISLTKGCWCSKCKGSRLKTQEEFESDLYQIHGNTISAADTYINDSTKMLYKCNKCGYIWSSKPRAVLCGNGCPKCKIKHLERDIDLLLKYTEVEYQKTFEWLKDKSNMFIDFYIPSMSIAIECQGIQHFMPIDFAGKGKEWAEQKFNENLKRDLIKKQLCEKNGIKLFYYTTDKILSKNQIKKCAYDKIYNEYNLITDISKLKNIIYGK